MHRRKGTDMAEKQLKTRCTPDGRLIRNTVIKVRLHPTPEQAALFDRTFGCCRWLWNQMLADEQRFYAETGEHFIPTPARYKKEAPFLKEVDSQALCSVHQSLRQTFMRFFRDPEAGHYPNYKRKKARKNAYQTFCHNNPSGPTLYLGENGVRLPKAGMVRARLHRRPLHWWVLKSAVVSRSRSGKYFCSLIYEYAVRPPKAAAPAAEKTLGLLYSMSRFYVDSEGRAPDPPHWLRQSQEKLGRMQRRLHRMQPGSKNYEEQVKKLQRLHEHIANQRLDFIHKESRRIANAWDAVCIRSVDLREMSRTHGNVMEAGFGRFRICLQYKLERQGKPYVAVSGPASSAEHIRELGLAQLCA